MDSLLGSAGLVLDCGDIHELSSWQQSENFQITSLPESPLINTAMLVGASVSLTLCVTLFLSGRSSGPLELARRGPEIGTGARDLIGGEERERES